MRAARILIIGNYGAGNLGDDAIFAGISTELREAGFSGEISVLHGGFESSMDLYGGIRKSAFVPAGLLSLMKSTRREGLEAIKNADLVILGGGGLFTDEESERAPMIWATQVEPCIRLKKPFICYGQSVGPLKEPNAKKLTKKVFNAAAAIHVRDQASREELMKLGVEKVITVGTDPAFSWLKTLPKRRNNGNRLAVSLRFWTGVNTRTWKPLLKEIKEWASAQGLEPELIAMDLRSSLENKMLESTGLKVNYPQSAREAFEFFQNSRLAVNMRLHASIFSTMAGTPTVILSYSQKVEGLFKSLGHKTWNLNEVQIKEALQESQDQKISDPSVLTKKNLDFLKSILAQS